ncbi:transcriptional regulator, LacI family [Poseidonocella pacifica]|uniref:Transcriptional regulator, LacI family n=1 Tax=Poseidonocella pacifica TaxID=871651 RepID=A0A1I0X7E5_9RHOB|nr:LacI family DNA-binding transcriptional regulator [Poseidonocella pacifica]SFA96326.1 transcriptional regulator, LacI family [Poseidonocella pacifica]
MAGNKRVTLAEVAALAGVSAITVSRAIRQPGIVSEKVKNRVEAAVRELGYVPNPAARLLATGRSNVIGVVIPSITNNVFADVVSGIYDAVEGTDFEVQLGNTRYSPSQEEGLLRIFSSQRPAGLIVAGIDQTAASLDMLASIDCPVVQIMELSADPVGHCVGLSHYEAARHASAHLVEQGYRRVGFLGARMDPRTQRRFSGFREVAEAAGVFDERRVCTTTTPSSVTLGSQLLADLLAKAPDVDAIFCNNDDLALGALFEAQRRRLSVPDQLGICGFNDLEMVSAAEPAITSVFIPRYQMGRQAVDLVTQGIASDGENPTEIRDLGFELRARRSTARKQD